MKTIVPEVIPPSADRVSAAVQAYRRTMHVYHPLYRTQCLPDRAWQRTYLEYLRQRWRYHVTDARCIQRLGDWWRPRA